MISKLMFNIYIFIEQLASVHYIYNINVLNILCINNKYLC